jgi:hypothetical protein
VITKKGQRVEVTRDEVNALMSQMGSLLTAISNGTVQVVESDPQPARRQGGGGGVRQLRAADMLARVDHDADGDGAMALSTRVSRKGVRRNPGGPRVHYSLKTPERGKLDLSHLTPATVNMAKYLSMRDTASVKDLMADLKLKRSTIMNGLAQLRKKGIVETKSVVGRLPEE